MTTTRVVVLLPQKTVVTTRKVTRLAQYLRLQRQGRHEAVPWAALSPTDQQWWFRTALEHLAVAELVLERSEQVALSTSVGEAAGVLPPADGAVRPLCQR